MRIAGMRPLVFAVVSLIVLAACGAPAGSGGSTPASSGLAAPSPADTPQAAGRTAPGATGNAPPPSAAARAVFLSHAFTDVRDGKQFTLSEFAGKQLLVIGMAVW